MCGLRAFGRKSFVVELTQVLPARPFALLDLPIYVASMNARLRNHGSGMSKSLQIFLVRKSIISRCRELPMTSARAD